MSSPISHVDVALELLKSLYTGNISTTVDPETIARDIENYSNHCPPELLAHSLFFGSRNV